MNRLLSMLILMLPATLLTAAELRVTVHHINASGVGEAAGVIIAEDGPQGLRIQPFLTGLQPGNYKFTVNENVGCGAEFRTAGENIPGMAAGKQMRQLPSLTADLRGNMDQAVIVPELQTRDLRGRTLVISEMTDTPFETGATAERTRIACGSLEQYR